MAASVAFAVVLGFSGMWDGEGSTGTGIASNDPTSMVAGPDDVLWQSDVSGIQADRQVSDTDVQRAQAYILHHTQQQAIKQAGVMSFDKLATYEAP